MSTIQMSHHKNKPITETRIYRIERRFCGERYAKDVVKSLLRAHSHT